MFIRPPRSEGEYRDRDLDCQEAIEPDFLAEVRAASTPYIDLAGIRAKIAIHALEAGWREDELDNALQELVRCYLLSVRPIGGGADSRSYASGSMLNRNRH